MIDIDNTRKQFIKYSKQFDLKEKSIMEKFHHSFRVMDFCIEIAKSLKLSEEDINLAGLIGMLHDIGRYEQWTKYKTFIDSKSVDHGDLGHNILKENNYIDNFVEDEDLKQIILIAIKNHNKYQIEDNFKEKELLMTKIIRDADKLDIIKEQGNTLTKQIDKINNKIITCFDKKSLVQNNLVETESDHIFRMMSFIYDLNFKYSYEYLLKNKVLENKIHLLKCYSNEEKILDDLENQIITYLKERCE